MTDKKTEALKLALKKAFDLGKRYWQQANSDFTSQWRKADVTLASFNQLVEDTIREALAEQPAQQQDLPDFIAGAIGVSRGTAYDLMRDALAEAQQQEPDNTDDPLQGAVDWLLQADGEYFCTATVQRTLRIGYNRAKRLCDTAKERAAHGIKGDA